MSKLRPLSVDMAISDRLTGETLRRAIIRAYMADELTMTEIAEEFGCHRSYVVQVTASLRQIRCNVRNRRLNARVEQGGQDKGSEDDSGRAGWEGREKRTG